MSWSMRGIRRERGYQILKVGEEPASASDKEKAEMMANALLHFHSSDNLSEVGKRERAKTTVDHTRILDRRKDTNSTMDAPFTLEEIKRAILRTGITSPGNRQSMLYNAKTFRESSIHEVVYIVKYGKWENHQLVEKKQQLFLSGNEGKSLQVP